MAEHEKTSKLAQHKWVPGLLSRASAVYEKRQLTLSGECLSAVVVSVVGRRKPRMRTFANARLL